MNNKIEILAPAGSYEGMKAAMNAGCDAVYIGGSSFGARAYANNLEEDILLQAIDEAHIRGKRLYLTVNTLVKEKERTQQLYNFLEKYYLQGLDAVIVQDVGVMHFIHKHFPGLPIHASTQTTLTMAQGANLLKDIGVTRLVTARELSLKEIKNIRDNTDLEIETFVHGALCYCYSGQCLMSSMIGGRSGNRGRCAQPCRMPYQFYYEDRKLSSGQEKYLLSPKDINTVAMIPELVEAGVDSFKIEGRMKKPEYAAAVASIYRKYTDYYLNFGKEKYYSFIQSKEYQSDMMDLMDIYNRGGFSQGYGKTYHGKSMMSLYRPNHSGVYIGDVTAVKGSQVSITLKEDLNAQDILEIRSTEEEGYEFTVKDAMRKGGTLTTNVGRRPENPKKDGRDKAKRASEPFIKLGAKVYRTRNNRLLERITGDFINKEGNQKITGKLTARLGEKLALTISYQDCTVTAYHNEVQAAMKQPMTKEKLSAPVLKTGDTLYEFDKLDIEADEAVFVPVAWLSEIRRDAIRLLQDKVARQYRRNLSDPINEGFIEESFIKEKLQSNDRLISNNNQGCHELGMCVSIQTMDQFNLALMVKKVTSVYVDYDTIDHRQIVELSEKTAIAGKKFYLVLPHICRLSVYDRLKKDILSISEENHVKGFIVKNFEEIELLRSLFDRDGWQKEIILNHNMY
ncbi:MAG TPA: U32 family peptidase, partial [Mobilitalea sp.]|nr:U32 family peptidase [Mobilitalea sp.]